MILVIDNYDSFTYNLVQLFGKLGAEVVVRRNDEITPEEAVGLAPTGIVISPGPGAPSSAGVSKSVIRAAADAGIPLLGVCLGHQALAEEYGATIVRGDLPVHGKTAQVSHDGKGVLEGISSPFTATRYHSLIVDPSTVPAEFEVTARNEDGVIMGIQHRTLPLFGVQFHPESILTPEGEELIRNFMELASEPDSIDSAVERVEAGESLSEREAAQVMNAIMDGHVEQATLVRLLVALRDKGETIDEITGFARAMRAHSTKVHPEATGLVDTCGTGGDGAATFNISTATAFVVAAAGVAVAKHGNRAVSSSCGSADVLEELGVRVDLSPEQVARCIDEAGIGFLFAQALHPSMRHAIGARREIGTRTVFNILGPLTNPAGAKSQLLGVYDEALVPMVAEVAGRLGAEHVLVVHGHPGLDELSISGPTKVAEYVAGEVRSYVVEPEGLGLTVAPVEELRAGSPAESAEAVRSVLGGEAGPRRDIVVLNAAAALLAADAVGSLEEGLAAAAEAIDSGGAMERLRALSELSARLPEESMEAATTRGGA